MGEREIFDSGDVGKVNEASEIFNVALNFMQIPGPTVESPAPATAPAPVPENAALAPAPASAAPVAPASAGSTEGKKKRGRPRKYDAEGRVPLSPMPISASIPLTGEFSGWKRQRGNGEFSGLKRGRGNSGKPFESIKKSIKFYAFHGPGNGVAFSDGSDFTIHTLTVNSGEDVNAKIMSLSRRRQGYYAICILSAIGTISNVALHQPTSGGGTLTYEGIFEILSLCGSFMPSETGLLRSLSGGLSVSLAGPDGRVVGGGLAGLLTAASPVQLVVGSFLPGQNVGHKAKKQRVEHAPTTAAPTHVNPVSADRLAGIKPIMTPAGFQVDNNTASFNNSGQGGSRNSSATDDDDEAAPLPEKDSNPSHSHAAGVAC